MKARGISRSSDRFIRVSEALWGHLASEADERGIRVERAVEQALTLYLERDVGTVVDANTFELVRVDPAARTHAKNLVAAFSDEQVAMWTQLPAGVVASIRKELS